MRRRVNVYAAFTGADTPVVNVAAWYRKDAELLVAERKANGTAFPDERIVHITVDLYTRLLRKHGLQCPVLGIYP